MRFSYRYAVQGETLMRRGLAVGTIVNRQLTLINFAAPSIYYFDRDAPKAQAVFACAKF